MSDINEFFSALVVNVRLSEQDGTIVDSREEMLKGLLAINDPSEVESLMEVHDLAAIISGVVGVQVQLGMKCSCCELGSGRLLWVKDDHPVSELLDSFGAETLGEIFNLLREASEDEKHSCWLFGQLPVR